jgi:hypothetical protein
MKKNLLINPLTLKGNEILERQKQLMGISSINENKSNSAVELTKIGPDGNAYAVIRENHEWYIKKTNKVKNLVVEDFKYIGGLQNKKQEVYPSYAKAIKHLNLKFKSLAEAYNYDGDINVFENDNLLSDNVNMDESYSLEEGSDEYMDNHDTDLNEYIVPDWAMSALINGDYSGLSDEDEQKLEMFIKEVTSENGNANFMLGDIDGKDDLGFKHSNDIDNLGSNAYKVYIKPDEDVEMTEYEQAIDEMLAREELHGGQGELDKNKNGKLDSSDFEMLRSTKDLKKKA